MIGLATGGETAIIYELKLGEVVTTFRTSGFGVETVEYKNLSFTVWCVDGDDQVRSLYTRCDICCQQQRSKHGRRCLGRAQPIDCG